jgi:hypothetical protein
LTRDEYQNLLVLVYTSTKPRNSSGIGTYQYQNLLVLVPTGTKPHNSSGILVPESADTGTYRYKAVIFNYLITETDANT